MGNEAINFAGEVSNLEQVHFADRSEHSNA